VKAIALSKFASLLMEIDNYKFFFFGSGVKHTFVETFHETSLLQPRQIFP
jgi:hypothetical protein